MDTTKRTADLIAGDKVRYQTAVNHLGHVLPLTDEHPGHVITVQDVTPWTLTAGRYAGQQARAGRGNTGALLYRIVLSPEDSKRIEGHPVVEIDRRWAMA